MKKLFVVFLLAFPCKSVLSASFDCNLASNTVEKLICTDAEASKIDEYFSEYYSSINKILSESEKATIKKSQINWIQSDRNTCDKALCIVKSYKNRELEIEKWLKTKIPEPLESETLNTPFTDRQQTWQQLKPKFKKSEETLEAGYRRQLKEAYDGPYSSMVAKNLIKAKQNWELFRNNYCYAVSSMYGGMWASIHEMECKIELVNSFIKINGEYAF